MVRWLSDDRLLCWFSGI